MVKGGANPFLRLMESGRIATLAQLRSAYRTLVLKTHPDTVGSDRLLDAHLSLAAHYEEARAALERPRSLAVAPVSSAEPVNHRLAYFRALHRLELLDKPYAFHRDENRGQIEDLKAEARAHFRQWNPGNLELYDAADRDYDRLKAQKPTGPYLKDALAINVSPVLFNVVAFHLTGVSFYKVQVRQNLPAVLKRLGDEHCAALRELLRLLIDDLGEGPAVFDERAVAVHRRLPR